MIDVQENYNTINIRRCKHFASLFLGDTNLAFLAYGNFNGTNDAENIKLERLRHAFEVVLNEIAYEYVCFPKTETVVITDGKVHFGRLTEQVIEPLSLTKDGKEVKFKTKLNCIYAPDGEYEITYAYLPKLEDGTTKLPYAGARVSERALALGVCAQYCLMAGRYNDAVEFDSQYKDALNSMKKTFIKRKVKKRRWL